MSDKEKIEEGDIVSIRFGVDHYLQNSRVLYTPCATGDSWRVQTIISGKIYYIQNFESMELVSKKKDYFEQDSK